MHGCACNPSSRWFSIQAPCHFWAAPRQQGLWEKDMCLLWRSMGRNYPDWEDSQYLQHFRVLKDTFWFLSQIYGKYFTKEDTRLRHAIPAAKRLAIVLHWLAHASSFSQLAVLYAVGKSTVVSIVHQGIDVLREKLTPNTILFPTASELEQVMVDFEALCGLPFCAGALDSTFMPIKKPEEFGDTYFCYKKFCSIIVLGCVDARGIFTYVNAGRPGSIGDSCAFCHSLLYEKISCGEWLARSSRLIEGVCVKPFLVADSAFPLDSTCMKCYDNTGTMANYKRSFNYSLIRTRRVVEQAFGRLKGRWRIMDGPCVVQWHQCPFEPGWLPDKSAFVQATPANLQATTVIGAASTMRDALARHVHLHRPAPHQCTTEPFYLHFR